MEQFRLVRAFRRSTVQIRAYEIDNASAFLMFKVIHDKNQFLYQSPPPPPKLSP